MQEVPNNLSDAGTPHLWDSAVADRLETRYFPTCVILPYFDALDQTVWAYVWVPKKLAYAEAPPP